MLYAFYNARIKFLGAVYNFNLNGKKQIKTRSPGFMMTLFACYSTARRALKCPRLAIIIMHILENSLPGRCCLNYYYYYFFSIINWATWWRSYFPPPPSLYEYARTHTINDNKRRINLIRTSLLFR